MKFWDRLCNNLRLGEKKEEQSPEGEEDNLKPKLSQRKIYFLVLVIVMGVLLILLGSLGEEESPSSSVVGEGEIMEEPSFTDTSLMSEEEKQMAQNLEVMLSQIKGAGEVQVTIKLASSRLGEYVLDSTASTKTTSEKDQGGGVRTINEDTDSTQMVIIQEDGGQAPVLKQEQAAEILGVLVVAKGACDSKVKMDLFLASKVALGVDAQKILVLPSQ